MVPSVINSTATDSCRVLHNEDGSPPSNTVSVRDSVADRQDGRVPNEPSAPVSETQNLLLYNTRRHSLPASYTLSHFLSNVQDNESSVGEHREGEILGPSSPQTIIATVNQHDRSATSSGAAPSASTVAGGSVNRHRYGHRHTKSVILDQPVVVKTYNPSATPRLPTRTGMINPAVFEEESAKTVELPPIEAFSFDGILKAINPEVTRTLDKFTTLYERLKDDIKTEVESVTQTQKEIQAHKQQADRLASQALKTTNARCENLNSDASALRGGAAVEDLVQITERTYNALDSIITTLLAIDQLLPPQERLAPDTSLHQSHYPKLHELLNGKYHEISARFGYGSSIAQRKPSKAAPETSRAPTPSSPLSSSALLPASLPNPDHQEPGWLRRRMSSNSTMLLSGANSGAHDNDPKNLSLPPHLQLRTILPTPYGSSSPSSQSSNGPRRMSTGGAAAHALLAVRWQAINTPSGGRVKFTTYEGDSMGTTRTLNSNSLNKSPSGRQATGVKGFLHFLRRGSSSAEEDRGIGAEEKLRRVLDLSQKQQDSIGKGKGKAKAAVPQ